MPAQRIVRTSAHAGFEARQLAQRLAQMQQGEFVSYEELSTLCGRDVQYSNGILQTARRLVRDAHQKEFGVRINEGLVCLASQQILGVLGTRRKRQHTALRISHDISGCVQPDALTPLQTHQWLCEQTVIAAGMVLTHPKTMAQVEQGAALPTLLFDQEAHKDLFR